MSARLHASSGQGLWLTCWRGCGRRRRRCRCRRRGRACRRRRPPAGPSAPPAQTPRALLRCTWRGAARRLGANGWVRGPYAPPAGSEQSRLNRDNERRRPRANPAPQGLDRPSKQRACTRLTRAMVAIWERLISSHQGDGGNLGAAYLVSPGRWWLSGIGLSRLTRAMVAIRERLISSHQGDGGYLGSVAPLGEEGEREGLPRR